MGIVLCQVKVVGSSTGVRRKVCDGDSSCGKTENSSIKQHNNEIYQKVQTEESK